MISQDFIKQLSTKKQTTELNVLREYLQHLFLSYFYQKENSNNILFKGGTALKVIYDSPRFSEDLDFSGTKLSKDKLESMLMETLSEVEQEQVNVELNEAKTTSGGYLAIYRGRVLSEEIKIQLEISFRDQELEAEPDLINQDFIPPYTLLHLPEKQITAEKFNALLQRGKPRDWYDLYFILRSRLEIGEKFLTTDREQLKEKFLNQLNNLSTSSLKRDLKPLLPVSHHNILKDFNQNLKREIKRHL